MCYYLDWTPGIQEKKNNRIALWFKWSKTSYFRWNWYTCTTHENTCCSIRKAGIETDEMTSEEIRKSRSDASQKPQTSRYNKNILDTPIWLRVTPDQKRDLLERLTKIGHVYTPITLIRVAILIEKINTIPKFDSLRVWIMSCESWITAFCSPRYTCPGHARQEYVSVSRSYSQKIIQKKGRHLRWVFLL